MNRYLNPVNMNLQDKALRIILIFFITGLGSSTGVSQCIQDTNNIYTFITNQNTYQLIKENKSWADAQACAVSIGGHLAIINDQTEQDSLFANLNRAGIITNNTVAPDGGGAAYVWLAGNDTLTEGDWVWDNPGGTNAQFWQGARTGSAVGGLYNNWGNEPDNFQNQDGLGLALTSWPFGVAGEWNDVDTGNTLYYLVEFSVLSGLQENVTGNKAFEVYPNPATNQLNFSDAFKNIENVSYRIVDVKGRVVERGNYSGTAINVEQLERGIYWIKLDGTEGSAVFQKR